MKTTVCLIASLVALTSLVVCQTTDGCGETCDVGTCQSPEDCLAGIIKDRCNCCSICGQREGERCFNQSVARFLPRTHSSYPDCGENLICRLRTDLETNDPPEAVCQCLKNEPICGSDDITYENECQLNEERYRRRDGLVAASRGPCKTVPKIVSPPEDIRNKSGSYVAFSCEVKGWPVPVIEWRVQKDSDDIALPSDDPHIAVQSRGGPSNYEVTGWLQLLDINYKDQGTYLCVAKNSEGQTKAGAKLTVTDYSRRVLRVEDQENEI